MENKKTLKPGQLATVKNRITGMRGIVRASKKFGCPCDECRLQNDTLPCGHLISLANCQEMFSWNMFPIVIAEIPEA